MSSPSKSSRGHEDSQNQPSPSPSLIFTLRQLLSHSTPPMLAPPSSNNSASLETAPTTNNINDAILLMHVFVCLCLYSSAHQLLVIFVSWLMHSFVFLICSCQPSPSFSFLLHFLVLFNFHELANALKTTTYLKSKLELLPG